MVSLSFSCGTLEIKGLEPGSAAPPHCVWDSRTRSFRAPAHAYAPVVRALSREGAVLEDRARGYGELDIVERRHREPRPFQREALEAWLHARGRGVVVLPTGAGKTHVAVMAMAEKKRDVLVIAPTLDLVRQWYDLLRATFGVEVGVVGGGEYRIEAVTVATYDSAYLHMERLGNRFGLVVFDECHHLPSESYALAARFCLAPFRLGLSATPERADGRHAELEDLIGPTVYRRDIVELSGEYLAGYDVERITVDLSAEELEAYNKARSVYLGFVRRMGIRMSDQRGWSDFVLLSSRNSDGRKAMEAYLRQRRLAFAAPSKLEVLDDLLFEHRKDKTIVFTQDNATAYAISRRFLVPVITHQTRITERSSILAGLSSGLYGAIATSKVLNEGVDVPEANVAIVISGSGSVREHVQRLGRILRKKSDCQRAVLYELVAGGTSETYVSQKRRAHSAYR